jgi:PiT family inorganic phosphate transporter
MDPLVISILVILFALAFTYTNGFHDTANAIATVVGTKVLTPRQAIMLAAVTNLIGAFFGLAVAKTISTGLVDTGFLPKGADQIVLICGLFGAISWNLITWWFGMPSSSSHALIGGLCGSVMAAACITASHGGVTNKEGKPISVWDSIIWDVTETKKIKKPAPATPEVLAALGSGINESGQRKITVDGKEIDVVVFEGRANMLLEESKTEKKGLLNKVFIPMVLSPIVGFLAGFLVMAILYVMLRSWRPVTVNRSFGKAQLMSSAYMGFSHGMNDATKCMGLITLALVGATKGHLFDGLPGWLSFLKTTEGTPGDYQSIGTKIMSGLPSWLQFGYMPDAIKSSDQHVPNWVVVVCALTMAAGTAAGGWRIIKTMGHKMVKLQPVHGFAAETTAATVLAFTGHYGMPVSTTHAITTSIMGVGCAKRFSAIKFNIVERILWAWILTFPAAFGLAFGLVWVVNTLGMLQLNPAAK